jgi:hypothetical protein
MQAPRDANYIAVALGWDGTTTQALRVDPVTGRLLLEVDLVPADAPAIVPAASKIDENHVHTMMGVTDDATTTVTPLFCKAATSRLSVDFG